MSSQPDMVMSCPICLETMSKPILQCQKGHSMCGICITSNGLKMCPCCRGPLSETRNFQLEQLIDGVKNHMKLECCYASKGCKFSLKSTEKNEHELECKFRKFQCEGKKFAKWNCNWSGDLVDLHEHFKKDHKNHSSMEYRTEANLSMNLKQDYYDVQIISFFNGQHYFYYKHKVDVARAKVYWTIQFIGRKAEAKNYYYEFEVHEGPIRKFKVTEICENDVCNTNEIFESEKCVVMSFALLKTFLNDDEELPFKFRIMSFKKATAKSK